MTNNICLRTLKGIIDVKYISESKGSVINYREGGLQNWKVVGQIPFVSPPQKKEIYLANV